MKRKMALAASSLCAVAILGAATTPASAAPPGQGLVEFGPWNCEGLGEVELFGPRGFKAASVFTTTGLHLNLLSLEVIGPDFEFAKIYGQKAGLTTFACTQSEGGVDAAAVVGVVPPQ